MITLLHISDLHFGPPYLQNVGESVQAFAARLQPTAIIASGDFTQRARREQFAAARAFLDRLPKVPTVVTPGPWSPARRTADFTWAEAMGET